MRQTANYQLSQWDPEDRILREDFNGDNQRIDETMAALKAGNYFEKLADVTTTQSCQQLDVDLSGVDFTQYDRLIIHAMIKTDSTNIGYLRINSLSDPAAYNRSVALATFATVYNSGTGMGDVDLIFGPGISGRCRTSSLATGEVEHQLNEGSIALNPGFVTSQNLRQLNFYCANSCPVLPGTKVRVYGVRI